MLPPFMVARCQMPISNNRLISGGNRLADSARRSAAVRVARRVEVGVLMV